MNRFLVMGATALIAASLIGSATPAQAAPTRSTLAWGDCPTDISGPYPHLKCSTLTVPKDHANPSAGTLTLTLDRVPAKNPAKRRGVLLLNPGGPGGTTLGYLGRLTKPDATGKTRLPAAVLDTYDVIGFDVRGVGHSSPISCVDPSFWKGPQLDPDAASQRPALWDKYGSLAKGCKEKVGDLLPHLGTESVAKDMDLIRVALGEKKISYLGYSYGTYMGTTYATLFPSKVDRMILDGVMNPKPAEFFYRAALAQDVPMYDRFGDWQTWAAKYDGIYHLGADAKKVRATWDRVIADLRKAPHGAVGPSELISLTYGVMFAESGWPSLAQAISDYTTKNDDKALVEMATPDASAGTENGNALFNAVACLDSVAPRDRATWERDAAAQQAKAPMIGWYNMFQNAACTTWPVAPKGRVKPTGKGLGPVLMFSNLRDPSTPHSGAVVTHSLLPTSRLVSVDSGRHCEFAAGGLEANARVNQIGADYLVNGTVPAKDMQVPGHPLPDPTAQQATFRSLDKVPAVH